MAKLKQSLKAVSKRVGRAAAAFAGPEQGSLAIERHGDLDVAFRRGTADERVIAQSFANDIFYAAIPDYRPAPTDILLDIGAHIGTFALASAPKVPKGKVWAIEASQDTFNYLRINVAINGLANVHASHLALTDKTGRTRLYHDQAGNWGHSIMSPLSSGGEEVETDTLAGYMASNGIEHVDFAKLNCEGAEFPILLGAPPEVLRKIDRLLILFHCDLAKGYTLDQLTDGLKAAGFELEVTANKKQRGRVIARRPGLR